MTPPSQNFSETAKVESLSVYLTETLSVFKGLF
jgi:hypothetical protein